MLKVKKILSAALALVMTASMVPMAFAADETVTDPSAPVKSGPWTGDQQYNLTDGGRVADSDLHGEGKHAKFGLDKQEFTFVQTEPDQQFSFEVEVAATLNSFLGYAWVYSPAELQNSIGEVQGVLNGTIGKASSSMWLDDGAYDADGASWDKNIMGALLTTATDRAHLKITFTGDGAGVYAYEPSATSWKGNGPAITMVYNGQEKINQSHVAYHHVNLPLKITVLDHQALNPIVSSAAKIVDQGSAGYTELAWEVFMQAYEAAVDAQTNYDLTQDDINGRVSALQEAIQLLQDSSKGPAVTALQEAVNHANAVLENSEWYVDSEVEALNTKIDRAEYLIDYATANDLPEVEALTAELYTLADNLTLKPADFSGLEAAIEKAASYYNDGRLDATYESEYVSLFRDAYDAAVLCNNDREGKTVRDDQGMIDTISAQLNNSLSAMLNHKLPDAVTTVTVSLSGNDSANSVEGNVIYHMTPWYKTWTSQTVDLTVKTDNDAAIQSISWVPANWSVDTPEAKIENYEGDGKMDRSVTIRPTFGIGPRSFWVKAVVTDKEGNTTESAPVKVRFINYDWQK